MTAKVQKKKTAKHKHAEENLLKVPEALKLSRFMYTQYKLIKVVSLNHS